MTIERQITEPSMKEDEEGMEEGEDGVEEGTVSSFSPYTSRPTE